MELGPRDRLSQAFWHEQRKGRTLDTPQGPAVHLDLRHLGRKRIHERLPLISEAAKTFMGVDTVKEPIPVCPAVHYTMGGIHTNARCETAIAGLYAAGECASVGIHGANRLGSNSLVEIVVFGHIAGEAAAGYARSAPLPARDLAALARPGADSLLAMLNVSEGERLATLRDAMRDCMEDGVGIYRSEAGLREACVKLAELRHLYRRGVRLDDRSRAFNTEWHGAIELGFMLEVAEAMAHSALARRESRGAHQRLDFEARDDKNFLRHSLAHYDPAQPPKIDYCDVVITKSQPGVRDYSGGHK
jgi:fumarate reductase flavoprotein subunit